MDALLQVIRSRLSNRTDSEHGQAFVRVAMLLVVLAYLLGVVEGRPGYERALVLSLSFLAIEFGVALAIVSWLLWRPRASNPRRVLGMVADYSLMGVGMYLLSALSAHARSICVAEIGNAPSRADTRILRTGDVKCQRGSLPERSPS